MTLNMRLFDLTKKLTWVISPWFIVHFLYRLSIGYSIMVLENMETHVIVYLHIYDINYDL